MADIDHAPATRPEDLSRLIVDRLNDGDVDGLPFTRGTPRPTLRSGDFALTSTRLPTGATTVEVAHRQPDGTWRWIIDQPNVAA